jgi:hypothetical protein
VAYVVLSFADHDALSSVFGNLDRNLYIMSCKAKVFFFAIGGYEKSGDGIEALEIEHEKTDTLVTSISLTDE